MFQEKTTRRGKRLPSFFVKIGTGSGTTPEAEGGTLSGDDTRHQILQNQVKISLNELVDDKAQYKM